MKKAAEKPAHVSQEDWGSVDVPEATDEEWSRAIPFKDAHPDIHAEWKRGRGRSPVEQPKVHRNFDLQPIS